MAVNPARPAPPIGWPLLPAPDASGSLAWPDLETSVRTTLRAILVTRPGERLLHPSLGAGLQDFLHAPNTVLTRRRIHDRVAEAVALWEPRVSLVHLLVEPEGAAEEQVRIRLDYRIRATGAAGGLSVALKVAGD